jgi:hypothetical protein
MQGVSRFSGLFYTEEVCFSDIRLAAGNRFRRTYRRVRVDVKLYVYVVSTTNGKHSDVA